MSINVTIDGLDTEVDVSLVPSAAEINPESYVALRGLKGDKGDTGDTGATGATGPTGATGNGIASAVLNADYTLTLTFTDGTSCTTSSIRGEKGEKGDKGDAGDIDTAMSDSSSLPVQNRVIKSYVDSGLNGKANTSHNHTVSDVTDFPSIPSKTSDLTNDSGFITSAGNTTYTLTKSGNTITLTGSDGESTSVTDANTTYSAMTQAQATAGTSTSGLRISPKVLHDTIQNALPTVPDALSDLTNDMTVSDFTNDAGYITGYTETDPTVPSWAKASSKPSYTASEVGAVPTTRTVNGKALSANITLTAADVGAVATETDPVFTSSAAYGITTTDIDHWDSGYIELDTTAVSGEDYELYTAITAQGWTDSIV